MQCVRCHDRYVKKYSHKVQGKWAINSFWDREGFWGEHNVLHGWTRKQKWRCVEDQGQIVEGFWTLQLKEWNVNNCSEDQVNNWAQEGL